MRDAAQRGIFGAMRVIERCTFFIAVTGLALGLTFGGLGREGPLAVAHAQEAATPLGEKATRAALLRLAAQAVGRGHVKAAEGLVRATELLGHPAKDVAKTRKMVAKKAAKSRGAQKRADSIEKGVGRCVTELRGVLESVEGEARLRVARAMVLLDTESEMAQLALGREQFDGSWVRGDLIALLRHRKEIGRAVHDAGALEVPIKTGPSNARTLQAVTGERGQMATWGKVEVHAVHLPPQKLERIVRMAVRTGALSRYLRTGKLELPKLTNVVRLTILPTTPKYREGIRAKVAAGKLKPEWGKLAVDASSWLADGNERLSRPAVDVKLSFDLFSDMFISEWWGDQSAEPQVALQFGHVNWCAMAMLGVVQSYSGIKDVSGGASGSGTSDAHRNDPETEIYRLGQAGLLGARAFLRYLVERGEDPAWSQSFQDQLAKIQGPVGTKAAFVAQYLHESQDIARMLRETTGKAPSAATFEAALGTSIAEFEARWRAWMLSPPTGDGVVQRLRGSVSDTYGLSAEERALVIYLDGLRRAAIAVTKHLQPVGLDPETSRGCALHARYLIQNRAQLAAWPDAHEEWPDKPGFDPAGSWAGLHSVIAPGCATWRNAIDGWMGTFYHRLPLLDPGLIRIGWGMEDDVAVLDATSMVGWFGWQAVVTWPPRDGKDVGRHFAPELPNPVPGADQSAWGYPVTVQLFMAHDSPIELEMSLFAGSGTKGEPIDAYFLSPQEPANPELVPESAYCLIPKQALAGNATYTVRVRGIPDQGELIWSFRTGR